jgi:DNA-binding MarR family transcriptional regulator
MTNPIPAPRQMLDDLRLSSTAKITYLHLADWPKNRPVSTAELARRIGVGTSATSSAIRQLEEFGWITVDRSGQRPGRFTAPRIRVHLKPQT